jgi:hypothetical protein
MAEKNDKEKKEEAKAAEEALKKKKRSKQIKKIVGAIVILLVVIAYSPNVKWSTFAGASQPTIDPHDVGVLTITTEDPPVPMEIDPDQNCTQQIMVSGVNWEQKVNGILFRQMIAGEGTRTLVDPASLGPITNMSFRIMDGQTVQTAKLAYVKYRKANPPQGWYNAALENQ